VEKVVVQRKSANYIPKFNEFSEIKIEILGMLCVIRIII